MGYLIMKDNLKNKGKSLNMNKLQLIKEVTSLMKYLLAYKSKSQMHMIREKLVFCALTHGNEEAANKFECHRNTVSKWKNIYLKEGIEGLKNRSRAPHHIPHKIRDYKIIDEILDRRDETGYGAERLKMQFDLSPSVMTINRILHLGGKIDDLKKKHERKEDLWQIKKTFKALETKLQLDGKYLLDIPNYYYSYKVLGLPKWQFTLRDVKSGAVFLGFMNSENGLDACTFMTYVFEHFKRYGIDVSKLTIQTDGASYIMNLKSLKKTKFQALIEDVYGAKLKVKPRGGTKQSDVETLHSLIEREFYDRQIFSSVQDFYEKAYRFLYHFNYIRKNRHKEWKAPVYYLNQDRPKTSIEILDLPPIYLPNHQDIYWSKLNPKHVTTNELEALNLYPEELEALGIKDFSHEEYLDQYIKRVYDAYSKVPFSAHDLPIHPI